MSFLTWLESTRFVAWMFESLFLYPAMLTIHAFGLALTVGVILVLDLRLLGLYSTIPVAALDRLLGLAWVGIVLNTLTGVSIFMTRASQYVTNVPFVAKMVLVLLGCVTLVLTQRMLRREAQGWDAAGQVSAPGRRLALGSAVFWTLAVVTGRMIAYV